ncbi:MAG: hypothetical protein OEM98_12785 [Gammaproteobacteria bacterium]|nr:hypothetical protein [Gammaproteobacteria bacterium]
MRTHSNPVGDRVAYQIVHRRFVRWLKDQIIVLHIPYQQALPFQVASHTLADADEEAIAVLEEYARRCPGFGHVDLAIVYPETERLDEARAHAARHLEVRPSFTITAWRRTQHYKNAARLAADCEALAQAGLPQ